MHCAVLGLLLLSRCEPHAQARRLGEGPRERHGPKTNDGRPPEHHVHETCVSVGHFVGTAYRRNSDTGKGGQAGRGWGALAQSPKPKRQKVRPTPQSPENRPTTWATWRTPKAFSKPEGPLKEKRAAGDCKPPSRFATSPESDQSGEGIAESKQASSDNFKLEDPSQKKYLLEQYLS